MKTGFLLFLMMSGCLVFGGCKPAVTPVSEGKVRAVKINRKPLPVHQARVSAYPVNQVWPGYQRPLEQTEIASFASFDADGTVDVEVESDVKIETVTVRPLSKNIKPEVAGNKIRFQVKEPCQLVVEINDRHKAFHLFVNPVEKRKKNREGYTYYFERGHHRPGVIELKDNESVYVEEGAVVETLIRAKNAKNISVEGRGIIDAASFARDKGCIISLNECTDVWVEGVILKDAPTWTFAMYESKNVHVENIKLIGMWRYNSDGIDVCNSTDVTVNNSFLRCYDDCIVLKGQIHAKNQTEVTNVYVDNCVLWCDWGTAIQIGAETVADSIHHCVFRNCDIVHFTFVAAGIHSEDRAWIYDIHYENIRVEEPIVEYCYLDNPQNPCLDVSKIDSYGATKLSQTDLGRLLGLFLLDDGYYSQEKERGKIFNIRYKNIQYRAAHFTKSTFTGIDENHDISDILLEDIYVNGKKVTGVDELIQSNEYVSKISIL